MVKRKQKKEEKDEKNKYIINIWLLYMSLEKAQSAPSLSDNYKPDAYTEMMNKKDEEDDDLRLNLLQRKRMKMDLMLETLMAKVNSSFQRSTIGVLE